MQIIGLILKQMVVRTKNKGSLTHIAVAMVLGR